MEGRQTGINLLRISVGGFLVMSLSFLLMPVSALGIIPGLLFWLGLILGVISQMLLEIQRRRFFKAHNVDRKKMQKPHCGLLTFGSNRYAKTMDRAFLICLVLSIVVFCATKGFAYICNLCISLTVFTFCMHCVLNGRNYFHVMHHDTVQKALETNKNQPTYRERARKRRGAFEK